MFACGDTSLVTRLGKLGGIEMIQPFAELERRLAQNSADLRDRMEEMQKLRLAVKRAEASFSDNARTIRHRASPSVIAPSTGHVRP
jgi:hypothetical protein